MLLYTFFDGDVDVLFDDGTGGLFDFDFSLFDALLVELLRERDGDFDTELSLEDFDGLFSGLLSGTFSMNLPTAFSGELSLEYFSFLLELYFDSDVLVLDVVLFDALLYRE